ncbi:DUF4249 domain-containing protein [candidate division KSB1 bacterium]|nr:DUF4249 domain-containing protein [candidate division KSB1 bacterium]
MKLSHISILGLLLGISACESDSLLQPADDVLVVQAYLYANEPVDDIRLTTMLPLDATEDAVMPPVNNATVRLLKHDQIYELISSPGDSGYYHYGGTDLLVQAGDQFKLEIEFNGETVIGETTVPGETVNAAISVTTLSIPAPQDIFMSGLSMDDFTVTITWDNEENDYFYVTTENMEDDPEPVNEDFGGFMRMRQFPPSRSTEFTLNALQFTHLGTYEIKVYRVNKEYADLYDSQDQDSRSLNEPLSNIVNGLGIFSAFNSNANSLQFEATEY